MKRFFLILLTFCCTTLLYADEIDLVIPQSPQEMEQLLDDNAPCKGCGVVTDVRRVKDQDTAREDSYNPHLVEVTRTADDGKVEINYLTDSDTEELYDPASVWLVTVRYDDGAYDDIYQKTQPSVQEGDRVQVVSGRIVPQQ